ncbi:hypothetical protein JF780_26175 [Mycobacterium intracellulare]|uniref:hypothetical protein n=1 Tax=Mycobacterium intracellulare TaxID=1767 RepID=UPI001CDA555A|nr:hypothetical protein [Mycobacterium intracellulare]MCA2276751.1 hypothetical protein [Mycobacterium intracellulare]MCA2328450.1 hypothetical protein [Mycobacterium intracellulare]
MATDAGVIDDKSPSRRTSPCGSAVQGSGELPDRSLQTNFTGVHRTDQSIRNVVNPPPRIYRSTVARTMELDGKRLLVSKLENK